MKHNKQINVNWIEAKKYFDNLVDINFHIDPTL